MPYFEPAFLDEFARTLHPIAGANSHQLAEHLAEAFNTTPGNRPSQLTPWLDTWAGLLNNDTGSAVV